MKWKPALYILTFFLWICTLASCAGNEPQQNDVIPNEQTSAVTDSLALLRSVAQPGDLLVRLGDDFLSYQIRYMSHKDQSYSHVGIVVFKDGQKFVCHIYPDRDGADTIRYEPIDSFANPVTTQTCALYRYKLSLQEIQLFVSNLDSFAKSNVHFDKRYELSTPNVYCSEMIYKAITSATEDRISPKVSVPPNNMIPLLMKYFSKENPKRSALENWKFIAIDDLYLMPQCRKLMSINLQPATN